MGYFGQLVVACNCSALSIDFLVTSRLLFKEVGRLDEELSSPYTETDFCLRLSEKGYRHVFEPDVIARFRSSRPVEKKISSDNQSLRIMQKRWASIMTNDPLYSPNLNQSSGGYRMSNFPKGVLPFSEE
jgi:GT2 family glycosyltransferase